MTIGPSAALDRAAKRRHHEACEAACTAAKTHAAGLWDALAEVHRLEAYKILGYASFPDWAKVELNVSERQSYRYLSKAREVVALMGTGVSSEEAAAQVPLTPPPPATPHDDSTKPPHPTVADWGKATKQAAKLVTSVRSLPTGTLPPSTREALTALRDELDAVLHADLR